MKRFAQYQGFSPLISGALGFVLSAALAGCGNSAGGGGQSAGYGGRSGPAPVSLIRSFNAQNSSIQKVSLNSSAIAKAVDRYRINKKADPSPYQKVGVDLNGDGEAEALVYLTGETWCVKTGCTLAIFRNGQYGYRAISTVRRVKLPLRVAASSSQGWRDLIVQTGGVPGLPEQTVALKFTGGGYPGNATTIAPVPQGVAVDGVVILAAPPVAAAPAVGDTSSLGAPASQGIKQAAQSISLQP